jgi:hypothetical protein
LVGTSCCGIPEVYLVRFQVGHRFKARRQMGIFQRKRLSEITIAQSRQQVLRGVETDNCRISIARTIGYRNRIAWRREGTRVIVEVARRSGSANWICGREFLGRGFSTRVCHYLHLIGRLSLVKHDWTEGRTRRPLQTVPHHNVLQHHLTLPSSKPVSHREAGGGRAQLRTNSDSPLCRSYDNPGHCTITKHSTIQVAVMVTPGGFMRNLY